jgi:hypothetical protein
MPARALDPGLPGLRHRLCSVARPVEPEKPVGRRARTMPSAIKQLTLPRGSQPADRASSRLQLRIQGAFSALGANLLAMRYAITLVAISLTAAALAASGLGSMADDGPAPQAAPVADPTPLRIETCLSPADMREEVGERRVIAPVAAIRAARTVIPRAEIQRASLCRHEDGLVYMLTALRRDGHFVHVIVDARTGKVAGQY